MKKTTLSLAIMACLASAAGSVMATEYTSWPDDLSGIKAGDSFTLHPDYIYINRELNIAPGGISISIDDKVSSVYGPRINDAVSLGTGSSVEVIGDETATGLIVQSRSGSTGSLTADKLTVSSSANITAVGITVGAYDDPGMPASPDNLASIDIGKGSSVAATSLRGEAKAVIISGGVLFTADNANFSVSGKDVTGIDEIETIRSSKERFVIDLGDNSVITASGTDTGTGTGVVRGTGISLRNSDVGADFSARELTIDASGNYAIGFVVNNDSVVNLDKSAISATAIHGDAVGFGAATGAVINLGSDSTIKVTGNEESAGVKLYNGQLNADHLTVDVVGGSGSEGIILDKSTADLGTESKVLFDYDDSKNIDNNSDGNVATADLAVIHVGNGSALTADALTATSEDSYWDVIKINDGSQVDLGNGSRLVTTGSVLAAVDVADSASSFKANALTIEVSGGGSTGITSEGTVDLGRGSRISTNGSYGIANNGKLSAAELTVTAEDSDAVWVTGDGSTADIGEDSHISAPSDTALYLRDKANVNFTGTPDKRNTLYSGSVYGVAVATASTLNLKNTDITFAARGALGLGAIRVDGGSTVNGENLAVNVLQSDIGVYASNSSVIGLTGDLAINMASVDDIAVHTETDSQVNADGKMTLTGGIESTGGTVSMNMADGSVWTGQSATTADNTGAVNIAMTNSQWNITGDSTLDALTLSGSDVSMPANQAGTTLTVKGDYAGDNSRLHLNTVLAGDDSATDKLVIGGNATGKTDVMVTNLGGQGDQTVNGIEIVNVGGTADKGAFYNSQDIVGGMYYYTVVQKGDNFYLTSDHVDTPVPEETKTPETTQPPTETKTPEETRTPPAEVAEPEVKQPVRETVPSVVPAAQKNIRPVTGGYIANLAAANQMFVTRLADREGGTEYINPVTGQRDVTSLWLRQEGGHNRSRAANLSTTSNRYVAQLGGELVNGSFTDTDRWDIGLMAGYANQHGNTTSSVNHKSAKSDIHGYSTGLYGTWYQDAKERTGLYVDSWVQYSWFRNSVNEQGQPSDSYSSKGFSASLESGYSWKVVDGERTDFFIQPQAQLVWSGVKADDHRTRTGIHVEGKGENNLQSRLGVKAYLKGHNKIDDNTGRSFKPFVEASWIHNTERYGVRMNGDSLSQDGAKDLAEVKTGVEGQLSSSASVWGGIGVQVGDKGYSDTQGQVGFKYRF